MKLRGCFIYSGKARYELHDPHGPEALSAAHYASGEDPSRKQLAYYSLAVERPRSQW